MAIRAPILNPSWPKPILTRSRFSRRPGACYAPATLRRNAIKEFPDAPHDAPLTVLRTVSPSTSLTLLSSVLLVIHALCFTAAAQTGVQDIFGRSLNQRGITLVDWEGYLANPLIKFYVFPPTNAVLPGAATLTVNGARLYFDSPSNVSASGPGRTISLASATVGVAVRLSVFPDHDSLDEDYTLTIVFTGANNVKETNTVPIHVIDQDLQRTNDFVITGNFDRDISGFFTNATRRALVRQAADDWSYFFRGMNLDPVPAGSETTYIWSNNFNGGYYFSNTNNYTGYLLYAYGTTNSEHRSGGEGSYGGGVQKSAGSPLGIKRSGGFEAEILMTLLSEVSPRRPRSISTTKQKSPAGSDVLASLFKRGHPARFGRSPYDRLFARSGGESANCRRVVFSEFHPL